MEISTGGAAQVKAPKAPARAPRKSLLEPEHNANLFPANALDTLRLPLDKPDLTTDSGKRFFFLKSEGEKSKKDAKFVIIVGARGQEAKLLSQIASLNIPVPSFKFSMAHPSEPKTNTRMIMEWIPGSTFPIEQLDCMTERFIEKLNTMPKGKVAEFKENLTKLMHSSIAIRDIHFHVDESTNDIYIIDPMPSPGAKLSIHPKLRNILSHCETLTRSSKRDSRLGTSNLERKSAEKPSRVKPAFDVEVLESISEGEGESDGEDDD